MKKRFIPLFLTVILLFLLTACTKVETPVATVIVEDPAGAATNLPTEAPVTDTEAPVAQTDAPSLQQPPPAAPTIDGQELLETRCISCHALSRTTNKTGTFEEWDAIVTRMIGKGANLSEEEKSILVQYLADTYKK